MLRKTYRHYAMCGDSTSEADVAKLMDGEKADMVFTDPPYGMNLDTDYSSMPGGVKHRKIEGDDKDYDASFLLDYFSSVPEIFLFGSDYYCHSLPKNKGSWIVWDKYHTDTNERIGSSFELCWSKNRHKRSIARVKAVNTSWETVKERVGHPTQKPISLAEWFFDRWGKDNDLVVDLFLGSGSTLIACEKTNRRCYGMEIDVKYMNVILKRFEEYSGDTAERIS